MAAGFTGSRGGHRGQVVGQRVDDGLLAPQSRQQGLRIGGFHHAGGKWHALQLGQCVGAAVDHGDFVVTAVGQQVGDGVADVTGAKQGDTHEVFSVG